MITKTRSFMDIFYNFANDKIHCRYILCANHWIPEVRLMSAFHVIQTWSLWYQCVLHTLKHCARISVFKNVSLCTFSCINIKPKPNRYVKTSIILWSDLPYYEVSMCMISHLHEKNKFELPVFTTNDTYSMYVQVIDKR